MISPPQPNTKRCLLIIFAALSAVAFGQHDPGRNAVRLLAQKKIDQAVITAGKSPKKQNSPISEADRLFVLTMAACQDGAVAKALIYAKQAIGEGLPVERLLAGPRSILEPLYAHPDFQAWIAPQRKELLHGPLLGAVTDSSVGFWVRTANESDVQIAVRPENDPNAAPFTGKAGTSADADYTAVVTIPGLTPDTRYSYTLSLNGEMTGGPAVFRTFPKQNAPSSFSIAFGGGAGFTPQHEKMWTTIGNRNVDALLLLGDNVYIDDPEHALTQHYCYYRRQSQPEFRQLTASTPVYSIYDDHDFGTNDCIPGPSIDKPAWKRSVWNVFTQNWNNPSYGNGNEQPGCWYDFQIGDVHFIMLDCRCYRDLKGGSMLGPVQKAWMTDRLKSSTGTFKVLVSSVPWSPGVKPGSKDTWDGFAAEREEIFSLIEKNKIEGVILMSADRHRTDFRKISRPAGYDLYEAMSSKLTNVHTHKLMENAKGSEFIMGYNKTCSFGLMEFDTTAADPQVKYSIVDIDNNVIDSRTLKRSQLSFGSKN